MPTDGGVAACGGAFDRHPIPAASASSMDCELCLSEVCHLGAAVSWTVACLVHHHHQVTPCRPGSLCQSNNSTLVPKQHHQTLGKHCSPPGPVPDVVAPQHTRDKDNSSKWLLKDRPTHAALQFRNQTTAVGYILVHHTEVTTPWVQRGMPTMTGAALTLK
jgi:hypothetical protein